MDGQAIIKVVFGQRGSGKSVKAKNLVRDVSRVLFYDTLGHDYTDGVVCYDTAELKRFWRSVYRGRFRIVYRPMNPQDDFAEVCRMVFACGSMSLVVEEVDLFFRMGRCDEAFTMVITRGRHAEIELIAVTQAPKGFGSLLRSQAHEWCIFSTLEPDHVDYFKHRCPGVRPDLFGSLPKYHYVHYTDGADTYEVCIDDPQTGEVQSRNIYALDRPGIPDGIDPVRSGSVASLASDGA